MEFRVIEASTLAPDTSIFNRRASLCRKWVTGGPGRLFWLCSGIPVKKTVCKESKFGLAPGQTCVKGTRYSRSVTPHFTYLPDDPLCTGAKISVLTFILHFLANILWKVDLFGISRYTLGCELLCSGHDLSGTLLVSFTNCNYFTKNMVKFLQRHLCKHILVINDPIL